MAFRISSKTPKAIDFNSFIACYSIFLTSILQSPRGLSWETVLNKREYFREAYDNFDIEKIIYYGEDKIKELLENKNIIRNKLKIKSSISNAKIFKDVQKEYGSFYNYLKNFTGEKIIYEIGQTSNKISQNISKDLRKRSMKFVGPTIIYSYLQGTGFIYSHEKDCFLYKKSNEKNL